MADKRLSSGQIEGTALTNIYSTPSNGSARVYSIVLTNATASSVDVDIYVNDGVADRLVRSVSVPSGIGKVKEIYEIKAMSGGDILKLQAGTATAFNYYVSGREI